MHAITSHVGNVVQVIELFDKNKQRQYFFLTFFINKTYKI